MSASLQPDAQDVNEGRDSISVPAQPEKVVTVPPSIATAIKQEQPPVAIPKPKSASSGSSRPSKRGVSLPPFDIVPFPSAELASTLQEDDIKDELLMTICSAFASVENRALCPKEIASVCSKLGWKCSGSQPFAVVSSCIRSHLRRRGMTATNSSSGRPFAPNLPPPLFASFELTGVPEQAIVSAIGVDKNAKPAVKRGTLWYLSTEGTGYASPFGALDPNLPENIANKPVIPRNKNTVRRSSLPMSTSLPNLSSFPQDSAALMDEEDLYGEEAMGRGKRKRKASSIAGGDSSWQTSGNKLTQPQQNSPSVSPPPPTQPNNHRRSGSIDSTRSDRNAPLKRLKLRLPSLVETPDSPKASTFDTVMDSESSDVDPGQQAAVEKRRHKKRSKSEGSLLSLAPAAMHYRPPPSATGSEFSKSFSGRSASPEIVEDGYARAWSADPMSLRPPGLLQSLIGRRLRGDAEMRPVDETDEEDDDFHEAILKSDFDFEFDFAFGQRKLAAARRRLESKGLNTTTEEGEEELMLDEDLELDLDTPATTPRSPEESLQPDLYELVDEAAKKAISGDGNGEMILLGLEDAKGAIQETLAEPYTPGSPPVFEDNVSPASPPPALPIVRAAASSGFAPAGCAPDEEEIVAEAESLSSSLSDLDGLHVFGHRAFSPAASSMSSFNADSEMHSAAASPSACSSNDSFDAEVVIGGAHHRLREAENSMSPSGLAMEDLVTVEEAQGEDNNLHLVLPTDVAMDELDLEFGGPVTPPIEWQPSENLSSTPPPTPFGPEVYGFFSAPQMNWQPAMSVITPTCQADSAIGLELGPGLEGHEDVDMENADTKEQQTDESALLSALEAATATHDQQQREVSETLAVPATSETTKPTQPKREVSPAPSTEEVKAQPAKPLLQRKTSMSQPTADKPPKSLDTKPPKAASTRSTRANPKGLVTQQDEDVPSNSKLPARRSSRKK